MRHASEKEDQLSKKKRRGVEGKKYGWFGRELQREDNVVKGACCVGGQRI